MKEPDLAFLYDSWLESYRRSDFARRVKKENYFVWHRLMIDQALKRPSTTVYVANYKGEEDVILGYMVTELLNGERRIVHYAYVKKPFRRQGLASLLFQVAEVQSPFIITHWTWDADPIIESKISKITYDPYRV